MERFSIGHSRSGKIISTNSDADELRSPEELFDAMTMLMALALREQRRGVNLDLAEQLEKEAQSLEQILTASNQLHIQKEAIGATVSIDLLRHGLRLLLPEFRD